MISVRFHCKACPATRLVWEGPAIDLPPHMILVELVVAAQDAHACRPPPPAEDPERTPY